MKKLWIAIGTGIVAGGIGFGTYLAVARNKPTPAHQSEVKKEAPQPLTWTDPSGFTFEYPSGLTVDKHDEDKENYAHIEFTHPQHPGNVIVWAKDTTAADVTAWVKTEKKFKGASVLDSTLGGLPAKKILLTDPTKMIIVGTVSDDIVWTVEATLTDSEFWTSVHGMISDTFKFVIPEKKTRTAGESGSSQSVGEEEPAADEEEVIE